MFYDILLCGSIIILALVFYLIIAIFCYLRHEEKPKIGLYLVPMIGLNGNKFPVKSYQGPFEVKIIDSTSTHYKIIFKDKEIREFCTDSPWVDKDFIQVVR